MSNMVFWPQNSTRADWREAFLVEGIYRASPDANGWTLEQLNANGGNFELVSGEEAWQRYSARFIRPVMETNAEHYNDMLEVLPPLDWHIGGYAHSFKMMEMTCGDVTGIFAKYGDRYFELVDHVTLTHQEIIEKVKAFISAEEIAG